MGTAKFCKVASFVAVAKAGTLLSRASRMGDRWTLWAGGECRFLMCAHRPGPASTRSCSEYEWCTAEKGLVEEDFHPTTTSSSSYLGWEYEDSAEAHDGVGNA